MKTTLKQRWPRTRYVLISAISLLVQLFNVWTIIGQDAAPGDAVVDHAATPGIELNDNGKPSLNDLVDRLAAIEDSYRRFSIRWHETSETNPDKPAEFKSFWPNRSKILLTYAQSQIGPQDWVDHRETFTNEVRTKWSQLLATEKGILGANDKQPVSAPVMLFDADALKDFLMPAPFEGIYALHDTGLKRSLLSQRVQDNPGPTSLEWIDDDAKITINFDDGPVRPRRVEVWLSHKHNWHPIRVRWFHPSSSINVPFRHEWEVTVFEEIGGAFRVKSGVKRFPLDLRVMSNTSSIAARERLIKLADESEKRNETLPVAYTNRWVIDAANYGDDVKAPLTWIEVDEEPHPPADFRNVASPAEESDTQRQSIEPENQSSRAKTGEARTSSAIFKLQNANVKDVARVIKEIYGGPSFSLESNEQTNSLVVHCGQSELEQIETVIRRLDTRPGSVPEPFTDSYPINAVGQSKMSIAGFRSRLDALEQPVLQLAERVRAAEIKLGKDHPDFARLRTDLRALVQQTFTARQEIQRAELAEFTRRLQRMQQSIETRERISEKIVERRVEELLNRESAWEPRTMNTEPRAVGTLSDRTVDSFLPWKSPKNGPNLEIAPTAWGEPINGLRLALAVTQGIEAARTKQLHLVVNNVSKTPIQLDNTGWADGFKMAINVRSDSGEQAETRLTTHDRFFGPSNDSYLLESGETVVLATKQIGLTEDMNSESSTADLLIVDRGPQTDADGQRTFYLVSTSINIPGIPGHEEEFRLHTGKVSLEFSAHVDSEQATDSSEIKMDTPKVIEAPKLSPDAKNAP